MEKDSLRTIENKHSNQTLTPDDVVSFIEKHFSEYVNGKNNNRAEKPVEITPDQFLDYLEHREFSQRISSQLVKLTELYPELFSQTSQFPEIDQVEHEIEGLEVEKSSIDKFLDDCKDEHGRSELQYEQQDLSEQILMLKEEKLQLVLEAIIPVVKKKCSQ